LSRLARSLKQILETAHDLEQKKQALKVLTRNIDTGTPEGRLFFHITAAFDEFQRELIVENTRAGLAAARKRGLRGGRPPALDKEAIRAAEAMLKDTADRRDQRKASTIDQVSDHHRQAAAGQG